MTVEDQVWVGRYAPALRRNTTFAALADLASSSDVVMRRYVACNPSTGESTLHILAQSSDYLTRLWVAENPATSDMTLERLAKDEKVMIRAEARKWLRERKAVECEGK